MEEKKIEENNEDIDQEKLAEQWAKMAEEGEAVPRPQLLCSYFPLLVAWHSGTSKHGNYRPCFSLITDAR